VHLEILLAGLGEGDEQPFRSAWPKALDGVKHAHRPTLACGADRYGASMPDLAIRPYEDRDEDAVLDLLGASLGKIVDERYGAFFRWKHAQNPFGRSFMWVAEVDGALAGFRSFLRWRFVDALGETVDAVRAVDTATHPEFQGLGIFRTLTMHGLDEMRPAGVSFVFNTPNERSRPGYLKMGWHVVGRVPVQVRPVRLASLARMVRARSAAELWSQPSTVGSTVTELLENRKAEDALQTSASSSPGLRPYRTAELLRWRYDTFPPVAARAVRLGTDGASFAVVRFRRRGASIEGTVDELVSPERSRAPARDLVRAAKQHGCDYLLAGAASRLRGFARTSRLGPVLTWRSLTGEVDPPSFALDLGDVELF
jgi:GNAT superfamily N-acetyltransferase